MKFKKIGVLILTLCITSMIISECVLAATGTNNLLNTNGTINVAEEKSNDASFEQICRRYYGGHRPYNRRYISVKVGEAKDISRYIWWAEGAEIKVEDESIATYKDKSITGVKEGSTTLNITLNEKSFSLKVKVRTENDKGKEGGKDKPDAGPKGEKDKKSGDKNQTTPDQNAQDQNKKDDLNGGDNPFNNNPDGGNGDNNPAPDDNNGDFYNKGNDNNQDNNINGEQSKSTETKKEGSFLKNLKSKINIKDNEKIKDNLKYIIIGAIVLVVAIVAFFGRNKIKNWFMNVKNKMKMKKLNGGGNNIHMHEEPYSMPNKYFQ